MSTAYPKYLPASIKVRNAGSLLLDAAELAPEPTRTQLLRTAQLCDYLLERLWQQRTAAVERTGAA